MSSNGVIHIGEAARWAGRACSRLNGYPWNVVGGGVVGGLSVLVGCLVAGIAAAFGAPGWAYPLILALVAWPLVVLGSRLVRQMMVGHFRKNLIERGVDNPLPWRIEVEPTLLIIRTGQVETRAEWSAVSEVFPLGPYWVFLIQGAPTFVPKRNFTGTGEEEAFVRTVLDRLGADAVKRSGKAVSFVG